LRLRVRHGDGCCPPIRRNGVGGRGLVAVGSVDRGAARPAGRRRRQLYPGCEGLDAQEGGEGPVVGRRGSGLPSRLPLRRVCGSRAGPAGCHRAAQVLAKDWKMAIATALAAGLSLAMGKMGGKALENIVKNEGGALVHRVRHLLADADFGDLKKMGKVQNSYRRGCAGSTTPQSAC